MAKRETIRDFYGRTVGYIDDETDVKIARDFYGRVVGKYDKKLNVTRDFYGRILSKGDTLISTLYNNQYTQQKK